MRCSLLQNYPNPFNPATTIRYSLLKAAWVNLRVHNILGEEVKVLEQGKKSAGEHLVQFDAYAYPSGIYFYRLQAEGSIETKQMVLLK